MSSQQIWELAGKPVKINQLNWTYNGKRIEVNSVFSLSAKVLPSRNFVAVLESLDAESKHSVLRFYKADGSVSCEMPNEVLIYAQMKQGEFQWFEKARVEAPDVIGVVFRFDRPIGNYQADYQVDINAATGEILGTYEAR